MTAWEVGKSRSWVICVCVCQDKYEVVHQTKQARSARALGRRGTFGGGPAACSAVARPASSIVVAMAATQ